MGFPPISAKRHIDVFSSQWHISRSCVKYEYRSAIRELVKSKRKICGYNRRLIAQAMAVIGKMQSNGFVDNKHYICQSWHKIGAFYVIIELLRDIRSVYIELMSGCQVDYGCSVLSQLTNDRI